jgi:hypothetical protein
VTDPDFARGRRVPIPSRSAGRPAGPAAAAGRTGAGDPAGTVATADRDGAGRGRPPGERRRDAALWLWPVVGVAGMAVAGIVFGPVGTVLTAIVFVGGVVTFVGHRVLRPAVQIAVVAACLLAAGVVVAGTGWGWPPLAIRPPAATAGENPAAAYPDRRGRRITADTVRSTAMRGMEWPGAIFDHVQIQNADLTGLIAPGASFRYAGLEGAYLAGAQLPGADLRNVHLRGADLRGANLNGADLRDADLSDACLIGADLTGARLDRAATARAAVSGATLTGTSRPADWPRRATTAAPGCR